MEAGSEVETTAGGRLRPFRVLPGGASAIPEEYYAAAILGGAILGLVFLRKTGSDAEHVHIGGASALVVLFYYLIVTALVRLIAANLAAKRGDTPLARAVGFFA